MKGRIRDYTEKQIDKLTSYIRRKYRLRKFEVQKFVSFDDRRLYSWGGIKDGGKPFINLAINYGMCKSACLKGEEIDLFEYEDYEHHPLIGAAPTKNWKFYIFRLVCHELAHCVELYPMRNEKRLKFHNKQSIKDSPNSGHGKLFQEIYIDLVKNNWNFESGK